MRVHDAVPRVYACVRGRVYAELVGVRDQRCRSDIVAYYSLGDSVRNAAGGTERKHGRSEDEG